MKIIGSQAAAWADADAAGHGAACELRSGAGVVVLKVLEVFLEVKMLQGGWRVAMKFAGLWRCCKMRRPVLKSKVCEVGKIRYEWERCSMV